MHKCYNICYKHKWIVLITHLFVYCAERRSEVPMKRLFPAVLILILVIMHSIPAYAEQDGWLCTQCGADASGNFCSNCGASRESAAAPAEDSAAGDSEDAGVKEIIVFGTYEQDNDVSDGAEPISWRILKKEDDKALVISCDALDCQPYHQEFTDITWENCTLRAWLNDTFLNSAFTDDERSRIQTVTVTADPNPDYDTDPGNDTQDRIFVLSLKEYAELFRSADDRLCKPTAYTIAMGAYVNSDLNYCCPWARTPGYEASYAANLYSDGDFYTSGDNVDSFIITVRPAMWIDCTDLTQTTLPETEAPVTEAPLLETEAPVTEAPLLETEAPVTEAPLLKTEAPLPETENPYVEAQELGRQKLVDLYAQLQEDQIEVIEEDPHYGAQVVVALFKTRTTEYPDISWHVPNDENYMGYLPQERLAKVLEDADTAVLIYPKHTWIGNYTSGGAANRTTTEVAAIDLHQMKRFSIHDVAVTDPPQTIYGAIGSGASGEMKCEDAMIYVADQLNAQSPEDYASGGYGSTAVSDAADITADQILDTLGSEFFRSTYEAVSQGEEIVSGTHSDAAKGLQLTLNEFGRNLAADGAAGNMTFEGLHQVQEALGLEQADSVNAETYLLLLKYLLLDTDEAMAASALGITDSGEAAYQHANVLKLKGQNYLAKLKYEESSWEDWEEQAAQCIVGWPENGKVFQNQNIQGSDVELIVNRNGDEGTAMQVDICTLENEVISSLFISGSGKATAYLPSGTYMIRSVDGNDWYGPGDAFGGEHSWSIMTFDSDEDSSEQVPYVYLPSGSWMITINAAEIDPDSESIGSMSMEEYLTWSGSKS